MPGGLLKGVSRTEAKTVLAWTRHQLRTDRQAVVHADRKGDRRESDEVERDGVARRKILETDDRGWVGDLGIQMRSRDRRRRREQQVDVGERLRQLARDAGADA